MALKNPLPQATQVEEELAPVVEEEVPKGHRVHAVTAGPDAEEYAPAGQGNITEKLSGQ